MLLMSCLVHKYPVLKQLQPTRNPNTHAHAQTSTPVNYTDGNPQTGIHQTNHTTPRHETTPYKNPSGCTISCMVGLRHAPSSCRARRTAASIHLARSSRPRALLPVCVWGGGAECITVQDIQVAQIFCQKVRAASWLPIDSNTSQPKPTQRLGPHPQINHDNHNKPDC